MEPKNKHDLTDSRSLHKMNSWGSHYPQASTLYATAQASTFYMITPLTHNNVSSVHTHYPLPVPSYITKSTYGTRDHLSPSNFQTSPASVTLTGSSR